MAVAGGMDDHVQMLAAQLSAQVRRQSVIVCLKGVCWRSVGEIMGFPGGAATEQSAAPGYDPPELPFS